VPTRLQVLIPISIAALIVGVAGVATLPAEVKLEQVEFPRGTIMVGDKILEVQIADTEPRHVRGLMFQEELPFDQGMLFVFAESGPRSMWMLNMQFPLDIIWFDEDGNIVSISKDVPPCKTPAEIMACESDGATSRDAKYALEVTAGFVDKFNIDKNSKLEIISI
tara:strand:- start:1301 stop:1795 length:495 start_codon:yes stop_codon:yes gene_type:complete